MPETAWRSRIVGQGSADPGSLTAHPLNPRQHPKAQLEALAGALTEVGWVQDIIVNQRTGRILDGHARVELALARHEAQVPVVYVDLEEAEESVVLASLDPLAGMALVDQSKLDALLAQVSVKDGALDAFLDGLKSPPLPRVDPGAAMGRAAELQVKWQTELGQLWEIGQHRVLCGDATSADDVVRVMCGEKAGGCFTSPPYDQLRSYEGKMAADWGQLVGSVFVSALPLIEDSGQIFVNLGLIHRDGRVIRYWDQLLDVFDQAGWPLFGWYVWDKMNGMTGDWSGRLAPAHEWIFHLTKAAQRPGKTVPTKHPGEPVGSGQRTRDGHLKSFTGAGDPIQPFKIPDSVIRVPPHASHEVAGDHPAAFPVSLPATFLEAWPFRVWYDPFLGSGTTAVAAEQIGLCCYGLEIEPKYVAVILERLSGMGLTPRLVS